MTKPEILYHGSSKIIEGKLEPKQARDMNGIPENCRNAIYATDTRELAIKMAILRSEGVQASSLSFNTGEATIYKGWPEQDEIYIYHLPSNNFEQTSPGSHQYASCLETISMKTETLKVRENIHLVKKASAEETKKWLLDNYIY